MLNQELPQMGASALSSASTSLGAINPTFMAQLAAFQQHAHQTQFVHQAPNAEPKPKEQQMPDVVPPRRLVQVFIADPDVNVPLDKALLYSGEQRLTDLSDQELFFEIDIAGALKAHNEVRVTLVDKSVKDKTVHLEPARIRDLRMTVVTIASF